MRTHSSAYFTKSEGISPPIWNLDFVCIHLNAEIILQYLILTIYIYLNMRILINNIIYFYLPYISIVYMSNVQLIRELSYAQIYLPCPYRQVLPGIQLIYLIQDIVNVNAIYIYCYNIELLYYKKSN